MLETKEQKKYFFAVVVLIAILSIISLWNRPKFVYQNEENKQTNQDFLDSQEYLKYLETINYDQKASQELFQTIITKEEITKMVEDELQPGQKIIPALVDEKKIKISQSNKESVNDYLTKTVEKAYNLRNSTSDLSKNIFNNSGSITALELKIDSFINELYATAAPKEALDLHKDLLKTYLSYKDFLEGAKKSVPADKEKVWPEVYKTYAITNASYSEYSSELEKITSKYQISSITFKNFYAQEETAKRGVLGKVLIPQANAFLGIGDVTITVGDIPRIIMDAVKEGIMASFMNFTGSMLEKLVTKIEENYKIANFLYYSDALINGQYVNDYLNKYVSSSLDRQIVKRFIPQFNCGRNPEELDAVFKAKAREYLGFDPKDVDVNDPDYYQKMAKSFSFFGDDSGRGWELYYEDLASKAQSEAQRSAELELTSSGLKTPRSSQDSTISASINSIISAEQAGLISMINLGISNAESIISSVVANLTQTLMDRFVFQGVSSNGNIAVYKEQPTCVSVAVLNPVKALPSSTYKQPPPVSQKQVQLEAAVNECFAKWEDLEMINKVKCLNKFKELTSDCSKTISPTICQAVEDFKLDNQEDITNTINSCRRVLSCLILLK